MKYLKTYEGIFTKFFVDKNIKMFISGVNKILNHNEVIKTYFSKWIYENKNEAKFIIQQNDNYIIENIYIEILSRKQWIEIRIKKDIKLEEIKYIEDLIIEYGDIIKSYSLPRSTQYNLILPKFESLLEKLTIEDFELYKDINKYNL